LILAFPLSSLSPFLFPVTAQHRKQNESCSCRVYHRAAVPAGRRCASPRHLQALVQGLFWREAHRLFPETTPPQPRLFSSTSSFLSNLRDHRSALAPTERTQHTCAVCDSVRAVSSRVTTCHFLTAATLDTPIQAVSRGVIGELTSAWNADLTGGTGELVLFEMPPRY